MDPKKLALSAIVLVAAVLGLDSARQHVEIRRRVGYVPETHHMYSWMTVREITRFCSAFYPTWNATLCRQLLDRCWWGGYGE